MAEVGQLLKDYILGPAHVGFVVNDLAAAMEQAMQLYGLTEADISYQPEAQQDAQTRFAFFSVGGLQFEYIQPCDEQFLLGQLDRKVGDLKRGAVIGDRQIDLLEV